MTVPNVVRVWEGGGGVEEYGVQEAAQCSGRFVRTEGYIEGDDWGRWIGKETEKRGW